MSSSPKAQPKKQRAESAPIIPRYSVPPAKQEAYNAAMRKIRWHQPDKTLSAIIVDSIISYATSLPAISPADIALVNKTIAAVEDDLV